VRETFPVSERHVCELLDLAVSSFRYRCRRRDEPLKEKLIALGREKPRFGYRRLHILLRRDGETVNHKRVWRVYREAGLCVKKRRRKRLLRIGMPAVAASRANERWSLDFASDGLASGRAIRVLSVMDTYTRECLALDVDTSFPSPRVTRVLDSIAGRRGLPERIRCDNGPELTSRHFLAWCVDRRITLEHIQPGRPMQNGHVESFHGKLRDECLNVSWFRNLFDARQKVSEWRNEYNQSRPHSSLGYSTPSQFAALAKSATTAGNTLLMRGKEPQTPAPCPVPPSPLHKPDGFTNYDFRKMT
jgi:putative transposase